MAVPARRRAADVVAFAFASLATAFGLFWLAWILWTTLSQGAAALAPSLFTQMTPPPGASGGLLNAFYGSAVMILLAHGFILTAMLWGGAIAFLIDHKIAAAAATLAACAVLALFGFIHSITPTGGIYLPWTTGSTLPYHWSAAYLGFAALILLLGRTEAFRLSARETLSS